MLLGRSAMDEVNLDLLHLTRIPKRVIALTIVFDDTFKDPRFSRKELIRREDLKLLMTMLNRLKM